MQFFQRRRNNKLGEALTPSLPQPVKCPGWMMHRRACKQYVFRSCSTSIFSSVRFDGDSLTCQCRGDKNTKGLRVSNFALLLVVFKRHYGRDGVKSKAESRFLIWSWPVQSWNTKRWLSSLFPRVCYLSRKGDLCFECITTALIVSRNKDQSCIICLLFRESKVNKNGG